jgi:hypothetical protein
MGAQRPTYVACVIDAVGSAGVPSHAGKQHDHFVPF